MADDRAQVARWTEPTSIQGADLTPEEECAARRAFRAWQLYRATGDRTKLIELGILRADSADPSVTADE